jgi:NLI interacting factor-like phosphatase
VQFAQVILRPHVIDVLHACLSLYEVVIYTASLEIHCKPVLGLITACMGLPRGQKPYHHLVCDTSNMWRAHTFANGKPTFFYWKDLRLLGRPLSSVILVDDQLVNHATSPDNGVWIAAFGKANPRDCKLVHLLALLQPLASDAVDDVRPELRRLGGLADIISNVVRNPAGAEELHLCQRWGAKCDSSCEGRYTHRECPAAAEEHGPAPAGPLAVPLVPAGGPQSVAAVVV